MDMLDRGIRHLPVMEDRKVIGVVSLRDLIRPLLAGALTERPQNS
jgi:signal-transduction protein with cAMP-binding, CBS, and nucleotidyltransferase domain